MNEPKIVINGLELSIAESMTVRIAIDVFVMELKENGLGTDKNGISIRDGYLHCYNTILRKMNVQ